MFAIIERLIFFLVVISTIRSGIMFLQRLFHGSPRRAAPTKAPQTAAATMLQQDPVCGTYVAIDTSLKRICGGKVVHFCSPECRDSYAG
jgi:YHS domain-containing protein